MNRLFAVEPSASADSFLRRLSIFSLLFLLGLTMLSPALRADDLLDGLTLEEDADPNAVVNAFTIELVGPDGKPIDGQRYIHRMPGYLTLREFPRVFSLAGHALFTAGEGQVMNDLAAGGRVKVQTDAPTIDGVGYRPISKAELPVDNYTILPFGLRFSVTGEGLKTDSPALSVEGRTLRIHTSPVTFRAVDVKTGLPTSMAGLELFYEDRQLLTDLGSTTDSKLLLEATLYLPRGLSYLSSLGKFHIDAQGVVHNDTADANYADGVYTRSVAAHGPKPVAPTAPGLWLWTPHLRRVYTRSEPLRLHLLAVGERPAGPVALRALPLDDAGAPVGAPLPLGEVAFPVVSVSDARLVELPAYLLPPGRYRLEAEGAPAERGFELTVVDQMRHTPLELFSVNCCNGADFTLSDAGVKSLAANHIQWVLVFGHYSTLSGMTTGGPGDQPPEVPVPAGAPPEMRVARSTDIRALDNMLRHGVDMMDYQNRRNGFYNEGLAFHHSYKPSVDRMIRRTQIFAEEYAEYPAFRGLAYTWYPQLGGYTEGGVATDPLFGARMDALNERVKEETGFAPLNRDEMNLFRRGTAEEKATVAAPFRDYYRAREHLGWYAHFKLYNERLKEVRPDLLGVTFENAGHDGGKRLADLGGALDAMGWESYTDYGDWPLSAGFTVDWSHGNLPPNKPVWINVEGLQTEAAQVADLMMAFARGADGLGVAMHSPDKVMTNSLLGRAMGFMEAYGSMSASIEVDPRIAVMSSELDGRGLYDVHALWSHLLRLGIPATVVSEASIERDGVPAGTQAILTANLKYTLAPETLKRLEAWQQAGGALVQVGRTEAVIDGAKQAPMDLAQLWELGGFSRAHLAFWQSFQGLQAHLQALLDELQIAPIIPSNTTEALVFPFRSGSTGYDFAAVVASPLTIPDIDFGPVPDITLTVGSNERWRNLATGDVLVADAAGKLTLALQSEPAVLLARLTPANTALNLSVQPRATAGETLTWRSATGDASADAPSAPQVPVAYLLTDSQGRERVRLYRLSGVDAATAQQHYRLSPSDVGTWTLTATNLLSGAVASAKIEVAAPTPARLAEATAQEAPPVFVARADVAMRLKSRTATPIRVLVEAAQPADVAEQGARLVEALKAAGRQAELQRVNAADFDTVKLRWYDTPVEEAQYAAIAAGRIVGYRGHMKPYVDTSTRQHMPERGGWTDIGPDYIVQTDAILFGGGRLADSLASLSPWGQSASVPGRGRASIDLVLSPFWADCDAVTIAAGDAAGRAAAVDLLIRALRGEATLADLGATPPPNQTRSTDSQPVAVATVAAVLPATGEPAALPQTPIANFVPPARVRGLSVAADGTVAVSLDSQLAVLNGDGSPAYGMPSDAGRNLMVGDGGRAVSVQSAVTDKHPSWGFTTGWAGRFMVRQPAGAGQGEVRTLDGLETFSRTDGEMPNWIYASQLTPDGQHLLVGLLGGRLAEYDLSTATFRLFGAAALDATPFSEALREPSFPTAMAVSGDGKRVAWTSASYPTGYGGMGTRPAIEPFATSVRLLDLSTGAPVFVKYGTELDDTSMAANGDCLALNQDGTRVAWLDAQLHAHMADDTGRALWSIDLADPSHSPRAPVPGRRARLNRAGDRALFASTKIILVADATGATLLRLELHGISSVDLSPDGAQVFVAMRDGRVVAYAVPATPPPAAAAEGDAGTDGAAAPFPAPQWTLATEGAAPRLEATAADSAGLIVASGAGDLLWVQPATGQVTRRLALAELPAPPASAATTTAAAPAPPVAVTGPPLYHEPTGSAMVARWGAKEVAAWTPTGATSEAYGYRFHAVSEPLTLSVATDHEALARLVYRYTGTAASTTVAVSDRDGTRRYLLDLPTPEYRVVELPLHVAGGSASITVTPGADAGFEVAAFTVVAYTLPGPNIAYVRPAGGGADPTALGDDLGGGMGDAGAGGLGLDLGVLDPNDPTQAAKALHGRFKKAEIYSFNTDPDKVAGYYFRETGDPLLYLDGQRYPVGKLPAWVRWKPGVAYFSILGARLLVDLTMPAKPSAAILYAASLKQSGVMPMAAILRAAPDDFSSDTLHGESQRPERLVQEPRVIAGRYDNDQFALFLSLDTPPMKAFAVQIRAREGQDHGLAEVELY